MKFRGIVDGAVIRRIHRFSRPRQKGRQAVRTKIRRPAAAAGIRDPVKTAVMVQARGTAVKTASISLLFFRIFLLSRAQPVKKPIILAASIMIRSGRMICKARIIRSPARVAFPLRLRFFSFSLALGSLRILRKRPFTPWLLIRT
jgi:hypothetical protein